MMDVLGYMEAVGWEYLDELEMIVRRGHGYLLVIKKWDKTEKKHLGPFAET